MEKDYYIYTLNYIQETSDSLLVCKESLAYLKSLPSNHPDKAALTEEMEEAYSALASNCEEFLNYYQ